jgi:tetratricopeptide (TPR) repeat protein
MVAMRWYVRLASHIRYNLRWKQRRVRITLEVMKTLPSVTIFFLFLFSIASAQQPGPTPSSPQPSASPIQLTRQQRDDYRRLLGMAGEYFKDRKMDLALQKLDEADAIFPDFIEALNLRGAVYAEKGDFGRANAHFDKALLAEPRAFWPRFNKAEVLLMEKKYAEARTAFEEMLAKVPSSDMVQFKLVLIHLKENDIEAAKNQLDRMKFPSDSAAYYYAHAAFELAQGKKEDGQYWIKSGDAIFGFERNVVLYDSLADLGWLEKRVP